MAEDDPAEGEDLRRLLSVTEEYVTRSRQTFGHALRAAHAKTYGGVCAEIEIYSDLPSAFAQGIFSRPSRKEVIIRFSNTKSQWGADNLLGGMVGIGIKILGVGGPKLLQDEPGSPNFDFAMINSPFFIAGKAANYLKLLPVVLDPPKVPKIIFKLLMAGGPWPSEWLWEETRASIQLSRIPIRNLLLSTYWTMTASRYGRYLAKLSVVPVPSFAANVQVREPNGKAGPEFFSESLAAEIRRRNYEFDLRVQLCTDLRRMPLDRITRSWPEELSATWTVARIRIPRQEILPSEIVDRLSINPWRVTEEHRPLGSLQRLRHMAYLVSSKQRHSLNNQLPLEPLTLADLKSAAANR
jgi:hypothetical protein